MLINFICGTVNRLAVMYLKTAVKLTNQVKYMPNFTEYENVRKYSKIRLSETLEYCDICIQS